LEREEDIFREETRNMKRDSLLNRVAAGAAVGGAIGGAVGKFSPSYSPFCLITVSFSLNQILFLG